MTTARNWAQLAFDILVVVATLIVLCPLLPKIVWGLRLALAELRP